MRSKVLKIYISKTYRDYGGSSRLNIVEQLILYLAVLL